MIKLIWAMDKNWLIGKENKMPWRVKEDLIYYKEKTEGKNVLMGYNTYISLKGYYKDRPLPYGKIYLATRKKIAFPDCEVISSLEDFLKNNKEELWVVGGSSIYSQSLEYASELYISFIKGDYEGDTYFPKFDLDSWNLKSKIDSELVSYQVFNRK